MKDRVKQFYEKGLWTIQRVWNVTNKRTGITEEEYFSITGYVYPAMQDEPVEEVADEGTEEEQEN